MNFPIKFFYKAAMQNFIFSEDYYGVNGFVLLKRLKRRPLYA